MATDRYLRVILTLIAVELLWLGLKDQAQVVSAQAAQAAPMRVVIAGVDLDPTGGFLPVAIAGSFRQFPGAYRAVLEPLQVRVSGPVPIEARTPPKIEADRPLKIESDRPLRVESVPYTPGVRPGE
jgi:hypothetical protein